MLFIPVPMMIAEILIFFYAIDIWGFWQTIGLYLAPSILGFLILSMMGRWALLSLQKSLMQGQIPTDSLLHSAALFIAGIFFIVPSFFSRVFALALFLPGSRHWIVAQLRKFLGQRIGKGFANFSFGGGGPGFGSGFRYYDFRTGRPEGFSTSSERSVSEANILDVKPIEIVHEEKKRD
jgi:UPF0716 protein FxsA